MTPPNAPLVLTETRPVSLCAWCTPKAEMERLNHLFADLSHGLCAACCATWNAELDSVEAGA